ncbi:hypothetical protein OAC78_08840 [Litorivicinus sp.]|nr:hypothetical protein [Litorivicinus sp.]
MNIEQKNREGSTAIGNPAKKLKNPLLTHYVNSGINLLDSIMLELVLKDTFFDMPQLLETATQREKLVSAFSIHEYWFDIGHSETLERAHGEWK